MIAPGNVHSRRHGSQPSRHARGSRRAFTLVEVLLALAVLTVLLAALYSAFDVYGRLSTVGREAVDRSRLARAVLRSMREDLHCVVFRAPDDGATSTAASTGSSTSSSPTSGSTTGSGGQLGSSGSLSSSSSSTQTQTTASAPQMGLVGDIGTLMIYIRRPADPLQQNGYSMLPLAVGELQSVSWFLATPNSGGLQGAVGNLAAGGSTAMSRETSAQGLARLAGDPRVLDQADAQGDLELMAANAQVVADEVNYLQFRYFDGLQWLEAWDSSVQGALPRAVEITIGLRPPQTQQPPGVRQLTTVGVEQVSDVYRLVVAMPMSQPTVTTSPTL